MAIESGKWNPVGYHYGRFARKEETRRIPLWPFGQKEETMAKMIQEFVPQGGKHCITNALKQVFQFYNCPLSEEMLFGLGEGLDFTYINLASAPLVSGRSKIIDFEAVLSKRLGISIKVRQSKDYAKVFQKTKEMIDGNHPVVVYVDMPYMDYMGMDPDSHFGGHSVVLFGYDDEQQCFCVSERDGSDYPIRTPKGDIHSDYHLVSYAQMEKARSSNSRPFPANNKYLTFDFSGYQGVSYDVMKTSIQNTCDRMLHPPAKLKGVNGIAKFSKEVKKWRAFDADKLKRAGATNYFQIHGDGGTGGGFFRNMFGGFLLEAAPLMQNEAIEEIGHCFVDLGEKWDGVARNMWKLYETGDAALLGDMSRDIMEQHDMEVLLLSKLQEIMC